MFGRIFVTIFICFFLVALSAILRQFTGFWWGGVWGIPLLLTAPRYFGPAENKIGEDDDSEPRSLDFSRKDDRRFAYSFLTLVAGVFLTLNLAAGYNSMTPDMLRFQDKYAVALLKEPGDAQVRNWLLKYGKSDHGFNYELKSSLLQILKADPEGVREALRRAQLEVKSHRATVKVNALEWVLQRLPEEEFRSMDPTTFLSRLVFSVQGYRLAGGTGYDKKFTAASGAVIAVFLCDPGFSATDLDALILAYAPANTTDLIPVNRDVAQLSAFLGAVADVITFNTATGGAGGKCRYQDMPAKIKKRLAKYFFADKSAYPPRSRGQIREFRNKLRATFSEDGFAD